MIPSISCSLTAITVTCSGKPASTAVRASDSSIHGSPVRAAARATVSAARPLSPTRASSGASEATSSSDPGRYVASQASSPSQSMGGGCASDR